MTDNKDSPKHLPRKKPKFTLLQIFGLIALAGIILTIAHQYGAF